MEFFATDMDSRCWGQQRLLLSMVIVFTLASCGEKGEPNMPRAVPVSETLPATDYEALLTQFEQDLMAAQEAVAADPVDATRFQAAQIQTNVGLCLDVLGRRDESIAQLAAAADVLRALPDTFAGKADTLGACADGLGLAYHGAGEHELAMERFAEAIEHRIAANNGMATVSKIHLGNLYVSMTRYSQARALLSEALNEAPTDSEAVILCHSALGRFFHTIGSYAEALDHHGEAEGAAIGMWGEDSEQVAGIRSDQASALFRSGRLDEARDRYVAVSGYYEEHGDAAGAAAIINNLANVDMQRGDVEAAAAHFQQAIDLRMDAGKTTDPELLTSLSGLGYLHLSNRNLEEAKAVFEEAERRALEHLGEQNPLTIEIRQGLGSIALAKGDLGAAMMRADQAFSSARDLMRQALESGTEEQQIAYRKKIDLMSLTCAIGDPELITERLVQTQGLVLESLRDQVPVQPIPDGTVTVGYVRYIEYDETSGRWTARYGAAIYAPGKPPAWCRLATDTQLRGLVDALFAHMAFEQAVDDGKSPTAPLRKLEPVLRRIHDLIWKPIADRLGPDVDHVAVCPDGLISAIPFAALLDGEMMLCEKPVPMSFFTTVRDVAAKTSARKSGASLACGESVFGAGGAAESAGLKWTPPYTLSLIDALREMGDLPGIKREIEALHSMFETAGMPLETEMDAMDERAIRSRVRSPRILHFASHAFVLQEEPGKPEGKRPTLDRTSSLERTGIIVGRVDPLIDGLKSGNLPNAAEDNILFTKEIAELELSETWLVTLSACSTGRGEQVSGEGVIGLQRGFFAAGAQHIAMTLWPLSDQYAPEFVAKFYGNVFTTGRPDTAMWITQRDELLRLRKSGASLGRAVWLAGAWAVSSQSRSW